MRKIFLFLSLMLPLTIFAQNNDWVGGGYSELEDEVTSEEGGSFLRTNDNSNYKVFQLGYNNVGEGNGAFVSMGWGKNITRHALPLYLEIHARMVYAKYTDSKEYYNSWGYYYYTREYDNNFIAFGLPLYLTYKFQAGNFKFFPITGPAINLLIHEERGKDFTPDFGATWDLGFRIGYKRTSIEYKRAFNLTNFMGDTHFVSLSFVF